MMRQQISVVIFAALLGFGAANNSTNGNGTTTSTMATTTTTFQQTTTTVTTTTITAAPTTTTTMAATTTTTTMAAPTTTSTTAPLAPTTTSTTAAPKAVVKGEISIKVDDPDKFINDPGAKKGVQKAIAQKVGVNKNWVAVSLAKKTRRLEMSQRNRRLQAASNIVITYTITIPATAASSVTGASLSQTIANVTPALMAQAISTQVAAESTETYAPITVQTINTPDVDIPGVTTTTTGKKIANSRTHKQAAITATTVIAVLMGLLSVQ